MDSIIYFFRDKLNGPLYYVVVVICLVLIAICVARIRELLAKGKADEVREANQNLDIATYQNVYNKEENNDLTNHEISYGVNQDNESSQISTNYIDSQNDTDNNK